MKLILLEQINNLEQLPSSINQCINLYDQGKIDFKYLFNDIYNYITNNLLNNGELPADENIRVSNLLKSLKTNIDLLTNKEIKNKSSTIFSGKLADELNELYHIIDDYQKDANNLDTDIQDEVNRLGSYDLPFEHAKTDAERREIITNFFSDENFWGNNISYSDLVRVGSPLVTQLIYKGFNEKDNPFLTYLKQVLPNRDITESKYRVLHNLYVDGYIDDKDLRDARGSKVAIYIRQPRLFKENEDTIRNVLIKAANKNIRQNRKQKLYWAEVRNNIGLNDKNYKTCMAVINQIYSETDNIRDRNIDIYNLPNIDFKAYNDWKSILDNVNITEDNYRDILIDINNMYKEK